MRHFMYNPLFLLGAGGGSSLTPAPAPEVVEFYSHITPALFSAQLASVTHPPSEGEH